MRTAELLDSLKQQEPISLSQILDAKEQRVCRQQEMMSRETGNSPKTLISFTLNIAGAIKSFPLFTQAFVCLLYTSPSPRDKSQSRMPSSA